jgi:hypothetical protein
MKSKTLFLVIVLLIGIGLTACQRDETKESPDETVIVETPPAVDNSEATDYPRPATQVPQTPVPLPTYDPDNYPPPEEQPTSPPLSVPSFTYPDIEDGGELSWVQAQQMILQGYVVEVMQTHELKVYLTLKDGRTLITVEPKIDDIFNVIEVCGETCVDIIIATE